MGDQKFTIDEQGNKIGEDGKIIPFTKNGVSPEPSYKKDNETLGQYRKRVDEAVKLGFHLGDLGWGAWFDYCNANSYPDLYQAPPEERHHTQSGYKEKIEDEDDW